MKDLNVSVTNDLSWNSPINIIIQMKQNGEMMNVLLVTKLKNVTSYSTVHLSVVTCYSLFI